MTLPPETDPAFAELLDDALDQVLEGKQPDRAGLARLHPAAAARVDEAVALAQGLAGRKVTARPTLQGYEIVRELGRGGMGTVYLARQSSLDREVALKVLPHSFGLSESSRKRFLEEARALARIEHEHIVGIHRIVDDGELLAFEMEFVDGPSLHTLLSALREHRQRTAEPGTLELVAATLGVPVEQLGARNPTQFFVRLIAKVARALAAVHAAGFVHRDVKPANVLLRQNGDPVVVDFGLVRLHGLEVTQPGRFAGTPVYSAPEQLRGEIAIGPTADVYSLGVTLYECLTLSTPFAGRTTTDLLQHIEHGRFQRLRRLAPGVPRDLETIVAHAMEVDPGQRYAHAGELAEDLQRLLELHPIKARPVHPLRRAAKFVRRNRRPLLAACVGAVLVAAALVPVVHRVEAATRARAAAAEFVRSAREHVLRADATDMDWRIAVRGGAARPRLADPEQDGLPLQLALADYERALALAPDDATARAERDVVRLAIWLREAPDTSARALESAEFRARTGALGPCTVRKARALLGDQEAASGADDTTPIDEVDRMTLGLIAYLFGDFRRCEHAWDAPAANLAGHPLVDAGLGRLLLADGMLETAYTRLLQAQRQFPRSATLQLDLTDAALRLGDVAAARRWLATAEARNTDEQRTKRRLELDLRAATEAGANLVGDYEALSAAEPLEPTPRHRLAQLAIRRGDLAAAERLLDELVQGWPEAAEFRLDRARVALQRRDLPAYAAQVLAVLERDFGADRSRGTAADLLEILRIGGLEELHLRGVSRTGSETTGRAMFGGEIPIESIAAPQLTRHFAELALFVNELETSVERLLGADRRLDRTTTFLLLTLPTAINRLPVAATFSPAQRLLLAALPRLAPTLYERCLPFLMPAWTRLGLGGWQPIQLGTFEKPRDLEPVSMFGERLLSVDDRTGDGNPDLLISCGTKDAATTTGRVLLVDAVTRSIVSTIVGDRVGHLFGYSLARCGDLDGDGSEEWAIGCPAGARSVTRGAVEIWSSVGPRRLHTLSGEGPSFGVAVAGLDDCDGDGCPDLAVATSPLVSNTTALGLVQVFSGRTLAPLRTLGNTVPGAWFGGCIANVGDADGDSVCDLLVGGNYGGAPGLARLYSGRTFAVLHSWTDRSPASGFGALVGAAGDVDADGCADVFVSAVAEGKSEPDQVFFYSGRTGEQLTVLSGARPGSGFGTSVARLGGAGPNSVFAIGSPWGGDPVFGQVQLCSLRGVVTTVVGPNVRGLFGIASALVADEDGDGLADLAVSAPGQEPHGMVWHVRSRDLLRGLWVR